VTPLERHCRLLLRAYPAWYRRERAGEMLGTLLEASPPGRRWPSLRDARSLVIGGLRVRGPLVWCLSMLWAGLGAAGAGYIFILSTHLPVTTSCDLLQCWVGEPSVIIAAAKLGQAAWLLLAIPVLVAGLVRLWPSEWTFWWAVAWAAGLALAFRVADWQTSAPEVSACGKNGCWLAGYRYAVVSWGELAALAGWLALGAAMTLILARRPRSRDLPDTSSRSSTEASL
jgi:hypothetical protein